MEGNEQEIQRLRMPELSKTTGMLAAGPLITQQYCVLSPSHHRVAQLNQTQLRRSFHRRSQPSLI